MSNDIALLNVVGTYLFYFVEFVTFFIFSFIGSLLKEIYNTNSDVNHEFGAHRVISSTFVATLASMAFKAHYLDDPSWALMAFITFVFGLVGFEIFKNLSSIDGIKRMIKDFKEIMAGFSGSDSDDKPEQPEKKPKDGHHKSRFHGDIRGIPITPRINIHVSTDCEDKDEKKE